MPYQMCEWTKKEINIFQHIRLGNFFLNLSKRNTATFRTMDGQRTHDDNNRLCTQSASCDKKIKYMLNLCQ